MKISSDGLDLIERFEGFRSHPYRDAVGVWTIGYGCTQYLDGRKVTGNDRPITHTQAEELLEDLCNRVYGPGVERLVKIEIDQDKFDALVSFAYNVGLANLSTSTLLRKLNAGDIEGAAAEFPKWSRAGGKVLLGLVRRRDAERLRFLGQA